MSDPTTQTCQTCSGYGATAESDGSMLTCPSCQGKGKWFDMGNGQTLSFSIPALLTARPLHEKKIITTLQAIWLIASCFLTVGLALAIVATEQSVAALIWNPSLSNTLFGISGISSIAALTVWQTHSTSKASLHDLESNLETNPNQLLNNYCNRRVLDLIEDTARTAASYNQAEIDEAVIMIALLKQPHIQIMLRRLDISPQDVTSSAESYLSKNKGGRPQGYITNAAARERLLRGGLEAITHQFPYIDSEDVFLSFARDPGIFADLFAKYNLSYATVYGICRWYAEEQEHIRQWQFWKEHGRTRPRGYMNRAWTALPTPVLDMYSRDLTAQAAQGVLASTQTRQSMINSLLEILGRLKKNSLVLTGEPGIGKRTIIEGLATRIIEGNVPEILKDKRLITLEASALLSSGDTPESAMNQVLEEIRNAGNVILVIPDVSLLVKTSDRTLDAASLLVNALANGNIQVITTATHAEYHRQIEQNPQLAQSLEFVEVPEPSLEDAVSILAEEASNIEYKQRVHLTYPAIVKSVELAKQYIYNQVLPSSALTLLDEASSLVKQEGRSWVEKEDVEHILEKHTDIPVHTADDAESKALLNLEQELHKRVVGQDKAITALANALRRTRAGLQNKNRPMGSFLFVGPTGVGKTETARAICEVLFKDASAMIRLDMSEYQDAQAIYRLIGPADVSSEGSGFTRSIREHPYSVILLDEIEKASPEILNVFLQVLDEGRLTENSGRTINMTNSLIIATSNASSKRIAELMSSIENERELGQEVQATLQESFKPEFLNRFDSIVPFRRLSIDELTHVTEIMLREVIAKASQQGYSVSFAPDAVSAIAQGGYDEAYGARHLRRYIQDHVESILAEKILSHDIDKDTPLQISADMIQ